MPKVATQPKQTQEEDKQFAENEATLFHAVAHNLRRKYRKRLTEASHLFFTVDGHEFSLDIERKGDMPIARFGLGTFLRPDRNGLFPMEKLLDQFETCLQGAKKSAETKIQGAARHLKVTSVFAKIGVQVDKTITFIKLVNGTCTVWPDGMVRFEMRFDPDKPDEMIEAIKILQTYKETDCEEFAIHSSREGTGI